MYTFQAVTDVELSLSFGDYVVVRKVLPFFLLHFNAVLLCSQYTPFMSGLISLIEVKCCGGAGGKQRLG